MVDYKIVSPSYKRAGRVRAHKYFGKRLILAVHQFEAEQYSAKYPGHEIMIIPDAFRGNMARVRNFIKDTIEADFFIMVDDDLQFLGFNEQMMQNKMDLDSFEALAQTGFQLCIDIGTVLWGVNMTPDPMFYREYSPISFLSPVLGTFCGHIQSKLRYDDRLSLNEDYDYFLSVIQRYRKVIRMNKYYYRAAHIKSAGGCGAYRVLEEEHRQAGIMEMKWGKKVCKYNLKRSTNPEIFVPLKGI